MEPLFYQPEEDVGEDTGEDPDNRSSDELDSKEGTITGGEETSLLVHQAKGNDSPEAAEEMRLGRLQGVVKLIPVENLVSEQVNQAADGANDDRRVNFNVA